MLQRGRDATPVYCMLRASLSHVACTGVVGSHYVRCHTWLGLHLRGQPGHRLAVGRRGQQRHTPNWRWRWCTQDTYEVYELLPVLLLGVTGGLLGSGRDGWEGTT